MNKKEQQKIAGKIIDFLKTKNIKLNYRSALELMARIDKNRDLHQAQATARKAKSPINHLSLQQTIDVIQQASSIVIDQTASPDIEISSLTGQDDNVFLRLEWTDDEHLTYELAFDEKSNRKTKLIGSSLFLTDTSGEEVQLTILVPLKASVAIRQDWNLRLFLNQEDSEPFETHVLKDRTELEAQKESEKISERSPSEDWTLTAIGKKPPGRNYSSNPVVAELQKSDWNNEHHEYTRDDWKVEVGLGRTQVGYWDWVELKLS